MKIISQEDYWKKDKYLIHTRDDGYMIDGHGEWIPINCPFCGFDGIMSYCRFCWKCAGPLGFCPKCQTITCFFFFVPKGKMSNTVDTSGF